MGGVWQIVTKESAKKSRQRRRDSAKSRANIIEIATQEFAERGLSGARVDHIAARTRTSKRMLYYYFGSKAGLYRAVLLSYYEKLRTAEQELDLSHKSPLESLQTLVEFTFDYHTRNAERVRLVMIENIHKGRNVADMSRRTEVNSSVLEAVADICERGVREGSIRPGLSSFDLYTTIAALCFFNVSNRYTFGALFKHDMADARESAARRNSIWEVVRRFVTP